MKSYEKKRNTDKSVENNYAKKEMRTYCHIVWDRPVSAAACRPSSKMPTGARKFQHMKETKKVLTGARKFRHMKETKKVPTGAREFQHIERQAVKVRRGALQEMWTVGLEEIPTGAREF